VPVTNSDNPYQQDAVIEVGDDSPAADAIIPEIAKVFPAKRFPGSERVVEQGNTVLQKGQDSLGDLWIEFSELLWGAIGKCNARRSHFSMCSPRVEVIGAR
jgi:hypothetical protein